MQTDMPTQVIFDMTEPDTKSLIDSWADNTEYEVTITLKTGAGENRHVAQAIEVTETGAEVAPVEAVEEEADYTPPAISVK